MSKRSPSRVSNASSGNRGAAGTTTACALSLIPPPRPAAVPGAERMPVCRESAADQLHRGHRPRAEAVEPQGARPHGPAARSGGDGRKRRAADTLPAADRRQHVWHSLRVPVGVHAALACRGPRAGEALCLRLLCACPRPCVCVCVPRGACRQTARGECAPGMHAHPCTRAGAPC
jgi:hypothetical protein